MEIKTLVKTVCYFVELRNFKTALNINETHREKS